MSRPSQVVVLSEDQRHQQFVRKFLYGIGYTRHDIRMEPLPSGRGCGEQWVRERYPDSVAAYRARSAKAKSTLVVVIDADQESVQERRGQLRDSLARHRLPDRANTEAIAQLIPKRNIETWLLFLSGRPVNEEEDYRYSPEVAGLNAGAVSEFLKMSRGPIRPDSLASLLAAMPEIKRLE